MIDALPAIVLVGIPVGALVLLDIVMVIRFGWSASAFYPPALRSLDAIMSLPLSKPEKPADD